MKNNCWYDMIKEACVETGDDFHRVTSTLTQEELKVKFDDGFGSAEGKPFTAWGKKFVYFPVVYDGAEEVGYAPRFDCRVSTNHWGGQ